MNTTLKTVIITASILILTAGVVVGAKVYKDRRECKELGREISSYILNNYDEVTEVFNKMENRYGAVTESMMFSRMELRDRAESIVKNECTEADCEDIYDYYNAILREDGIHGHIERSVHGPLAVWEDI